jgi:hypothetical protein
MRINPDSTRNRMAVKLGKSRSIFMQTKMRVAVTRLLLAVNRNAGPGLKVYGTR